MSTVYEISLTIYLKRFSINLYVLNIFYLLLSYISFFFAYAPMEKPRRIGAVFLSISVLQGLVTVNVPHLPVT